MNHKSFVLRLHEEQSGQVVIMVAVMLVMLLGFAAFVVDMGRIYVSYRLLRNSTDAAALAGAEDLPNSTAASTATSYSGVSGNKNAYSNLPNVTMVSGYPQLKCLTTLTNQGIACVAPANANAIRVKQQVSVPMTFAKILGLSSFTLTATATAAMRGGGGPPFNVAVIVDSTASMNNLDSGSNCSSTRLACSLSGIRILLGGLSPCASSLSTCGSATNGNVPNPVDKVSLFAFPAVTSATVAGDYSCPGSGPTTAPYPLPSPPSYTPAATPTYQIVNFSSDYRSSDAATSLNTNSNLVIAAGGKTGCLGLQAIGGQGSYMASAVYAAENLLLAQQAARPNSQNALIILSDGDFGASSAALPGASTTSGVYPSTKQQCHQAVTAAQWAATQGTGGTKVYTVAYGATSSGCGTDTTPSITPCHTMQQMASSAATFYSDYTSSSGGCVSASQSTTNLNQIFTKIAGDLSVSRLISDNLP